VVTVVHTWVPDAKGCDHRSANAVQIGPVRDKFSVNTVLNVRRILQSPWLQSNIAHLERLSRRAALNDGQVILRGALVGQRVVALAHARQQHALEAA